MASINLIVSFKPWFYEKVIYFIDVLTVQAYLFNPSIKSSYTYYVAHSVLLTEWHFYGLPVAHGSL